MRVLIVDDNTVMRKLLRATLRKAGFESLDFEEAGNGAEALESFLRTQPDLILSDWNMPERTGIELLEELNRRGSEVPFCFVAAHPTAEMKERAKQAGARAFVSKPFDADSLAAILRSL